MKFFFGGWGGLQLHQLYTRSFTILLPENGLLCLVMSYATKNCFTRRFPQLVFASKHFLAFENKTGTIAFMF
jgi:hypothetical protein